MAAESVMIEHDIDFLTINGNVRTLRINGHVAHMVFGPGGPAKEPATAAIESALRLPTRHKLPDAFFDGPNGLDAIKDPGTV